MSAYLDALKLMALAESTTVEWDDDRDRIVQEALAGATAYALISIAESVGKLTEWLTAPLLEVPTQKESDD